MPVVKRACGCSGTDPCCYAGASVQVGATGDQGVTGELPLGCCMPCGLCALAEQALSATPPLCS